MKILTILNILKILKIWKFLKILTKFENQKKKRKIEQKIKQIPLPYLDGWASWMGMSDKFIKKLKLFENVQKL